MKAKRLFILICTAALFLSAMLSVHALPVRADDVDYGKAAYEYLKYLTEHFPERVNYTEVLENQDNKVAAGEWIDVIMRGFGYQAYTIEGDLERNHQNPVKDYCYLKQGRSSKKVVIGAHYDSVLTEGAEDNGTGVSVLLELAKRFSDVSTELSVEFCFWDGEEFLAEAGSFAYVSKAIYDRTLENILLYINLDCVGSGDNLYAYGGQYENGKLVRDWGYNMAQTIAKEQGVELHTIPDNITRFKAPTRTEASDQVFFADQKVPYVYFEANAWVDKNGKEVNPEKPYNYNTTDPGVIPTEYTWANGETYKTTKGMIIHSQMFDKLSVLEGMFPGRVKRHMADTSKIVTAMLKSMTLNSPTDYAASVYQPSSNPPETTAAPTETEKATEPETTTEAEKTTEATEDSTEDSTEEATSTEAESSTDAPDETGSSDETDETAEETLPERDEPSEAETVPAGTESAEEPSPYRPADVGTVIAVVFIMALWGLWAYVYLKYYR